jgi:hypothetical protein
MNHEEDIHLGMDNIPDEFICPLTLEIFKIPMVTRYGHNFEKDALLHWLEQHNQCPLTRYPLSLNDGIINRSLLSKINVWKQAQRGHHHCQQQHDNKDETSDDDFYLNLILERPFIASCQPTKDVIRTLVRAYAQDNHPSTKLLVELFKQARKEQKKKRNQRGFTQEASTAA